MHIKLFEKKYWLRRFSQQTEIKGYLASGHADYVVSLHVHPSGSDSLQALPEGDRTVKRLEGHGDMLLNVSDSLADQKGDLLLYQGRWYECVSCQLWDHTLLSHYNYQFVLVPLDGSGTADTRYPPAVDPSNQERSLYL